MRSLGSLIFLILAIASFALHFISRFKSFDPGGALTSTAFLIQGGMFASMILGLYLMRNESHHWAEEVIFALPEGFSAKIIAKFLTLLTVVTFVNFIAITIFYILLHITNSNELLYQKSFLYFVLYWFFPFYVSGIIGMIAGLSIKSRLVYPLLVIVWLCIGPLNIAIFKPLMALMGTDLNTVANFFNLGQTDPNIMYDPVYGLPLEIHRWLQKAFWAINISCLFIILVFKYRKKKLNLLNITVLFVLLAINLPLISLFLKSDQVVNTRYEKNSVRQYDLTYYSTNKQPAFPNEKSILVEAYNINLASFRNLKAVVGVKFRPLQETSQVVFTLYHDLRVTKILAENNEEISFAQKGDQVLVTFSEPLAKEECRKIVFHYEGTSSPYFYANEQAVMLPAYFPWIPIPGSYQAMQENGRFLTRTYMKPNTQIKYELKYTGATPLYTNLEKAGRNLWRGDAPGGLTIAAGMLTETDVGKIKVVYPVTLDQFIKDSSEFFTKIKESSDIISQDLMLEQKLNLSKVYFLSIPSESIFSDIVMWDLQDHLIIGINQMYNEGIIDYVNPIFLVLDSLIRSNCQTQNETAKNLFIMSYVYWYSTNHDRKYSQGAERSLPGLIEEYHRAGRDKDADTAQRVKDFIDCKHLDSELMQSYFRIWLRQLNLAQPLNSEEMNGFFKMDKGE